MICSQLSSINHWRSSSLGHEVKTLKCKTFIQAFGGKGLCLSSALSARTCINIDHAISIIPGKHRYNSHINLGYATLVYATFHSGIYHFPFWHMPLSNVSILVDTTFHFGICHVPFWHMPLSILAYATFHSGICHFPFCDMSIARVRLVCPCLAPVLCFCYDRHWIQVPWLCPCFNPGNIWRSWKW